MTLRQSPPGRGGQLESGLGGNLPSPRIPLTTEAAASTHWAHMKVPPGPSTIGPVTLRRRPQKLQKLSGGCPAVAVIAHPFSRDRFYPSPDTALRVPQVCRCPWGSTAGAWLGGRRSRKSTGRRSGPGGGVVPTVRRGDDAASKRARRPLRRPRTPTDPRRNDRRSCPARTVRSAVPPRGRVTISDSASLHVRSGSLALLHASSHGVS